MAILTITGENRTLQDQEAITGYLASIGIDYDRWDSSRQIASKAPAEEILAAYSKEIRAIRLFQDAAGWAPNYTESGVDVGFEPMCFGASYFPSQSAINQR